MAAPAYIGRGTYSQPVQIPAHGPGDLIVITASRTNSHSETPPTGTTELCRFTFAGANVTRYEQIFYMVDEVGDIATVHFPVVSGENFCFGYVFSGVDPDDPIDLASLTTQGGAASPMMHGVCPVAGPDRLAVSFGFRQASDYATLWTLTGAVGGTWAQRETYATATGWNHTEILHSAEVDDEISGGSAAVSNWGTATFALNPPAAGGARAQAVIL